MWPIPQETVDLVTFTEEIPNWKLHFLCSVKNSGDEKGQFPKDSTLPADFNHFPLDSWFYCVILFKISWPIIIWKYECRDNLSSTFRKNLAM